MIDRFTRRGRSRRHHRDLASQFDRLLALAADAEDFGRRAEDVSSWSVGEQLEHVAKADAKIYEGLEALLAGESKATGGPVLPARLILLVGRIPRGRGKSPEPLRSTGIEAEEVASMLRERKRAWQAFESRLDEVDRCRGKAPHPSLGAFDARQWLRFAQIHVRHHVRIIDEILASG